MHFSHFIFNRDKQFFVATDSFDFNLSFCQFGSRMFLNQRKWIKSCFDVLNQSHSMLSCVLSVCLVKTNRDVKQEMSNDKPVIGQLEILHLVKWSQMGKLIFEIQ